MLLFLIKIHERFIVSYQTNSLVRVISFGLGLTLLHNGYDSGEETDLTRPRLGVLKSLKNREK